MSLSDLVKAAAEEDKKKGLEKKKRVARRRNTQSKSTSRSTSSSKTSLELKAKKKVDIDGVPIDALRGLYYFLMGKAEKKLTKRELKLTMKTLLSSKDNVQKLIQSIADVIMSES